MVKVKSSIIICKRGKTCIIQITPAGSDSQPQVSAAVKSLVLSILKTTHLRGSVTGGTCPDRTLPLPQVSVQHWEFGGETTGGGASGTSLSLPLLPSDPTATPQEVRCTTGQVQMGHCTAHFSVFLLLWLENL